MIDNLPKLLNLNRLFSNSTSPSVISCWISPFVDSSIFTVVPTLVNFGIWTCVWHSHCDCREMRFICVCLRGVYHAHNTHLLLGFWVCTWFMVRYVGVIRFVFHVSNSHEEACVALTNLRWSIMNIWLKIILTLIWISLSGTHLCCFLNRTHRSSQLCDKHHGFIELSDEVGWSREYVMQGARITPYGCLFKQIQPDKLRWSTVTAYY